MPSVYGAGAAVATGGASRPANAGRGGDRSNEPDVGVPTRRA